MAGRVHPYSYSYIAYTLTIGKWQRKKLKVLSSRDTVREDEKTNKIWTFSLKVTESLCINHQFGGFDLRLEVYGY